MHKSDNKWRRTAQRAQCQIELLIKIGSLIQLIDSFASYNCFAKFIMKIGQATTLISFLLYKIYKLWINKNYNW